MLHDKVHSGQTEKRRAHRKEFGMPVRSLELGLTGKTDTVEYGGDGTIGIVEMKRGKPKAKEMDEITKTSMIFAPERIQKPMYSSSTIGTAGAALGTTKGEDCPIIAIKLEPHVVQRCASSELPCLQLLHRTNATMTAVTPLN